MKLKFYGTTVEVRPEQLTYNRESGEAACKEHAGRLTLGCAACAAAAQANAAALKKRAAPPAAPANEKL